MLTMCLAVKFKTKLRGLVSRGLELIKAKKTIVRWCGRHRQDTNDPCDVPDNLGNVKQITGNQAIWDIPDNLGNVKQIAGGWAHSMALLADGTVRCGGRNREGQCDVPDNLGNVKQIACGSSHSMALVGSN